MHCAGRAESQDNLSDGGRAGLWRRGQAEAMMERDLSEEKAVPRTGKVKIPQEAFLRMRYNFCIILFP